VIVFAAGDAVIVLESMKMEIPVEAPRAGAVKEIRAGRPDRPGRRRRRRAGVVGAMSLQMIRTLYDYHRWANRRLFDVATTLGEELWPATWASSSAIRSSAGCSDTSTAPTGSGSPAWKGVSMSVVPGDEFATLASIRAPWDDLDREQRAFLEALTPPI